MRVANGADRFEVLGRSHLPQQGCGSLITGVELGSCNRKPTAPKHSALAELAIGYRDRRFETAPEGLSLYANLLGHTQDTRTGWEI